MGLRIRSRPCTSTQKPVDCPVGCAHTRQRSAQKRQWTARSGALTLGCAPQGSRHTRHPPVVRVGSERPEPIGPALTPRAGGPRGESQAQQGHLEGIPTSSALAGGLTKADLPTTTLGRLRRVRSYVGEGRCARAPLLPHLQGSTSEPAAARAAASCVSEKAT